jgi:hypothetical protein
LLTFIILRPSFLPGLSVLGLKIAFLGSTSIADLSRMRGFRCGCLPRLGLSVLFCDAIRSSSDIDSFFSSSDILRVTVRKKYKFPCLNV